MDDAPIGGVEESGPVDSGDTVDATEQVDEVIEEPRQYVEVDDPDNRWVRTKIDGEDVEVPYSEAIKGYSRTQDYTRKTTEAARMRDEAEYGLRLQQALEANPELTLQILAQQHGLTLAQQQAAQQAVEAEQEFDDPLEKALHVERQAREALEQRISQREADQALELAINGLRSEFQATDEDIRETIGNAYKMGVPMEMLPVIYQANAFQKLTARVQAVRAQQAADQAKEQERITAKTAASQVIANGNGAPSTGLTNVTDPNGRMTIREAALAALAEHGL